MEHLSLEVFDLEGTGSQYANLDDDASITITDTSEIFASGDVWSHSFTLNVNANPHIFGTAGDLHGSRLHDQIDKRRARLWVEGLPLFFGYLKLDDEAEVNADGDVDVGFEAGQKTFDDLIDGVKATEVSVGDVEIGIALNRKRVVSTPTINGYSIRLDGLKAYALKNDRLKGLEGCDFDTNDEFDKFITPYAQQFPKLVKSHGAVYDRNMNLVEHYDKTNIQTPYDGTSEHSFCNINVCYQMKAEDEDGSEVTGRGYTMRLARGQETTDGGDGETRYNNAPNFYLLYFVERLFKDMGIHIAENQAMEVEDLRRVFMLNYGCHYEEIETYDLDTWTHTTPNDKLGRYGQYYLPIIGNLFYNWGLAGKGIRQEDDVLGKVLLRDVSVKLNGEEVLTIGSLEGTVTGLNMYPEEWKGDLNISLEEDEHGAYSAYTAYATGKNYPDVEISEIIEAMKSMFGIRLLFSDNFKSVRIVLLRNVFRNTEVQDIPCEILDEDEKVENSVRGFRMTYGKGTDDTSFYYKGFNDLLPHKKEIWKDTTDKHDYSQFVLDAKYDEIKNQVSANNKTCYVTPVNGNAYAVKVDEDEATLFPSLFEVGTFMDAEDGDCTGEDETISEVQCGASPAIMNDVNGTYASLFTGDMKAPTSNLPENESEDLYEENPESPRLGQKIATYCRVKTNRPVSLSKRLTDKEGAWFFMHVTQRDFTVTGKEDLYLSEGFQIRMEDNYAISNGDTPFDTADTGLQFGIMRSSGKDAAIFYAPDTIEDETPMNDYWDVQPGSGAIDHYDTCDQYGEMWDYDGRGSVVIKSTEDAINLLQSTWPSSNIDLIHTSGGAMRDESNCIYIASIQSVADNNGDVVKLLFASDNYVPKAEFAALAAEYAKNFDGLTSAAMYSYDASHNRWLVEVGSSEERMQTLLKLEWAAFVYLSPDTPIYVDNGVGSLYGRFSLKLRAEKPNPNFDPKQAEDDVNNRRYLEITNENLRQRGLADQFYKEYSFWVRNARIVKRQVPMTLAQLLTIDKTKKVRVGDIMGFIRKMQYTVSNKTGLGMVEMEIMYI